MDTEMSHGRRSTVATEPNELKEEEKEENLSMGLDAPTEKKMVESKSENVLRSKSEDPGLLKNSKGEKDLLESPEMSVEKRDLE